MTAFRLINALLIALIIWAFLSAVGISIAHAGYRPQSFSDCAPSRANVISCVADDGSLYLVAPKYPSDRGKLDHVQFGHVSYNGKRVTFAGIRVTYKVAP